MFTGAMVALITPFQDGEIDFRTLDELIDFQLENGIDAIVPVGTTGESPTLSHPEHKKVIERVIKTVAGKVPVIAGAGSNSTAEAIELTAFSKKVGADATLQVCPYYNKPTQEGFYQHFAAIAEEVDLPIVLYNIPSRCGGTGLTPETIARLAEIENIVAIKEATGDMRQVSEVLRLCGDRLTVLSGDDFTTYTLMSLGGKGTISVSANVAPADVSAMCRAYETGNFTEARELHFKLEPLNKAMFFETNPVPVKTALSMMGKIEEEFRLPLCPMSDENREKLRDSLINYGVSL